MNIKKLSVGMKVKGKNCFGAVYYVTKINKSTLWLEHRTGEKVMQGGEWIDLVFTYKNVRPSSITEIIQ